MLVEEAVSDDAPAVGKAVHELNLSPGTVFMTIQPADQLLFVSADTVLQAGDQVALVTRPSKVEAVRSVLGGQDEDASSERPPDPMV